MARPLTAVILFVAITVILAAVLYNMVGQDPCCQCAPGWRYHIEPKVSDGQFVAVRGDSLPVNLSVVARFSVETGETVSLLLRLDAFNDSVYMVSLAGPRYPRPRLPGPEPDRPAVLSLALDFRDSGGKPVNATIFDGAVAIHILYGTPATVVFEPIELPPGATLRQNPDFHRSATVEVGDRVSFGLYLAIYCPS